MTSPDILHTAAQQAARVTEQAGLNGQDIQEELNRDIMGQNRPYEKPDFEPSLSSDSVTPKNL